MSASTARSSIQALRCPPIMHLTFNIVVNLPGEGGWIKMEFWKSGLLNHFALAVAVNRFLTEPIKIQQIDFRGRLRWSHHEAPVSLCNGWNFGCGSGRSQMTEGAGCRFDSLSRDYSLQGKKIDNRKETKWSLVRTSNSCRQQSAVPCCCCGTSGYFLSDRMQKSLLVFLLSDSAAYCLPAACLLYALSGFIWFREAAACHYYFCSPGSFATVPALFRFLPTCLVIPV